MNIGEKIRELRVSKLMTQADLAGEHITRNMLSRIENGAANPSLSTILYIASRLNVPAGFLLAEDGDEIVYHKMSNLSNIKRAYVAEDWRGCRELCFSGCPVPDDEICLLLAQCDVGIASDEFWNGRLHSSCRFFDEALMYAEKTIYPTEALEAEVLVYFHYMERISHTLYSDVLNENKRLPVQSTSPFSSYLQAVEAVENGQSTVANNYLATMLPPESFFASHIRVRLIMLQENYSSAQAQLLRLLKSEVPLNKIELYTVLCDLEICCRETDQFKEAYGYANEKVALLEQLLKDF